LAGGKTRKKRGRGSRRKQGQRAESRGLPKKGDALKLLSFFGSALVLGRRDVIPRIWKVGKLRVELFLPSYGA